MKIVGDTTVNLPYSLDFCAKGPDVDPLLTVQGGIETTLFFPPSMSDGTVGQSFFSTGWAWWTGSTLRVTASVSVHESGIDVEETRRELLNAANTVLRRFLNAYRVRFDKPAIYPVVIDSKDFGLSIAYENGTVDPLPEPEEAFFYHRIPESAPLDTSVNATTLGDLKSDLESATEPSILEQLHLDANWLESIGEPVRARAIRQMLETQNFS